MESWISSLAAGRAKIAALPIGSEWESKWVEMCNKS